MATKINEKSIAAYYAVRRSVDLLRDNGKIVTTIPELMEKLSPQFDWDRSNDKLTYRQKPICYIMDNHILSETETQMMLTEVDGLASIIISKGTGGIDDDIIQNTKMSEVTDSTGVDISKLDKEQKIVTACQIDLRGYEAEVILRARGFRDVYSLEGGMSGWPYATESDNDRK